LYLVQNSLDTDDENTLNQNNLATAPVKWHKKRKKQKDKSKVILIKVVKLASNFVIYFILLFLEIKKVQKSKKAQRIT